MLALSLPAIANPCIKQNDNTSPNINGGVGGTGHGVGGTGVDNTGGIGGTGIQQDNGTGGTGINANGVGGTGIVGVITGFGSLCIGELEVHLDENTAVNIDGVSSKQHQFKVGESVAIEASSKNNRISATKVHVYHQVIGPISEINIPSKKMKVMGQKVSATAKQFKNLSKGQWIGVSGIRNNKGAIEASNITKTITNKKVMVVGNIVQQAGKLSINGTELTGLAPSTSKRTAVRISGAWDGQKINVEKMTASPAKQLMQRVDQLYVQTYIQKVAGKQMVNVAGESITTKAKNNIKTDAPVLVKVNLLNGKANLQNIKPIEHTILNKDEIKPFEKADNKQEKHNAHEKNEKHEDHEVDHQAIEREETERHETERHETERREVERHEGIEKPEDVEVEKPEKVEIEKPEEVEVEKPEKVEFEKPEEIEIEKPEKVEVEKPEKVEIEKPEKVEIEKPEKVEIEKPEKVEFEKPEKIEYEKPEKIEYEKPEKIEFEKPEKIEYEKPEDIEYEKPEFD